MKYSIVIPVAKKDSRYLKRCLLSIFDQDYQDIQIIVNFDGFSGKVPFEDSRILATELPKQESASLVRNHGRANSTGDIILFLDVDCILFPGVLQMCADKLADDDIDFVYGGYTFNHATLASYPSRPYDPWLLESFNYISTMSPMKSKVFDKIDGFRNLPYFQDWDFFLRAAKAGFKGHFMGDFLFKTEVPNKTSISGGLAHKFREKIITIEKENEIKSRKLCVTTLSAPYQSIERAKTLDARYIGAHQGTTLVQVPSQYDFGIDHTLLMGFFPENAEQHMMVFPKESKKIIQWIGTDVWQMRNKFNWESLQVIKNKYLKQVDLQLCNSPQLQEELKEIGIDAEVVYQPLTCDVINTPLPQKPTISAYFSADHPLHGAVYLRDLANAMPDIDFLFFGTGLKNHTENNITYCSFMPIQEAIDRTTLHIRLALHDGFPHTPIQMLMGGRRTMSTFPLRFGSFVQDTPYADGWEELKKSIIGYIRENIDKPLDYDVDECRAYYKDLCSPENYKNKMYQLIGELDAKDNSGDADIQSGSVSCEVNPECVTSDIA